MEWHQELKMKMVSLSRRLKYGRRSPNPIPSIWREKDHLNGEPVDSLVAIFRTGGCRHFLDSGCTMCGYYTGALPRPIDEDLAMEQVERLLSSHSGEPMVKVYTSGSILDPWEFPPTALRGLLDGLCGTVEAIVLESRPEFVTPSALRTLEGCGSRIYVALGLESVNEFVRNVLINKDLSMEAYQRAVSLLRSEGFGIKVYVLLKPPFLTEREAMADSIATIKFALGHADIVSLNPVNIQSGTVVEYLWKRGLYRPPWLWTVVEVLKVGKGSGRVLVSHPTAPGRPRGPHNDGSDDREVSEAIYRFSWTQDYSYLEIDGPSRRKWAAYIGFEDKAVMRGNVEEAIF